MTPSISTQKNSPIPAHHFQTVEKAQEAAKLGTWVFLCTEILMFGGLFVAYAIYHRLYPQIFVQGSTFLDWKLGAINTAILLFSSLTMALSIYFISRDNKKHSINCLWLTLICGFIFLGIKYFEYAHKLHLGLAPGHFFSYSMEEGGSLSPLLPLYFSFYYCMTGIHGTHVIIGMGLIFWMIIRSYKEQIHSSSYTSLECVGLFWHLVDLIWIYLFPLLYLVE